MQLPRKRRETTKIQIGSAKILHFQGIRSLHRVQYFETFDVLISSINWRLDENLLQAVLTIKSLLLSALKDSTIDTDLLERTILFSFSFR